jgi:L-threonylcarbamoyladenylate synthase
LAEIGNDINRASEILNSGGLVAIPTETVYGLAANAYNVDAVVKVFDAKNRPSFDPLITHISHQSKLESLTTSIPAKAQKLIDTFWPGPLTLVLPKSDKISNLISSGLYTAAFRMPKHPLLHELLENLDFPVVAPSANPFGYVSPTSATHVNQQLGDKIGYILDGGESKIGLESTIISFDYGHATVLRLGGLSVEDIEAVIGDVKVNISSSSKPSAPGMLTNHYSPSKKVVLGVADDLIKKYAASKIGILSYNKSFERYPNFVLSKGANLEEAAANLFSALRWFENQDVDIIITENVPEIGLGRAINDRLKRASIN